MIFINNPSPPLRFSVSIVEGLLPSGIPGMTHVTKSGEIKVIINGSLPLQQQHYSFVNEMSEIYSSIPHLSRLLIPDISRDRKVPDVFWNDYISFKNALASVTALFTTIQFFS